MFLHVFCMRKTEENVKNILKKLAKYFIFFMIIVTISFFLPRLIPGSPLYALTGEGSGYSGEVPEAVMESFEAYYSPEKPIHQQFFQYLSNLAKFDLGTCFTYKTPVLDRIITATKWTLQLSVPSMITGTFLAIILGVWMGMMAKDRGKLLVPPVLAVQAVPTFILAALTQLVFAYQLGWFPATGAVTPGLSPGDVGYTADLLKHMILPFIVLTVSEIPTMTIFVYNSTVKVKKEPYVSFANYLGISKFKIYTQFIVKNILPDIIGRINIQFVLCIMGSLLVESVFSYPGIGALLRHATNYRDYPLMQGILLTSCIYGIVINLFFELFINRFLKSK